MSSIGVHKTYINLSSCHNGLIHFLFGQTALNWSRMAVSCFFITSDWLAPRFLIQARSIRNVQISLRWKPATVLIRKCHAHIIFGVTMENCVDKCVYAVFWSYLAMFAETVADNSRWFLVMRVNLGFANMAICFAATLLPVPICLPWRCC